MSMARDKIHLIFLFTSFGIACLAMMAASTNNISSDQSALLAFIDHMITSETQQMLAKNWSVSSSVCDWIGVTCGSRHRRVIALTIKNMNLTGTIPPQLGNLSFLVFLNISGNNFDGELPGELVHLKRLRYLDFRNNNLGGKLPSWLGYLHKLQFLCLRTNSFTGSIPPSFSNLSNLETLWLTYNFIQGTIPIEFQNLHNLKNLIIEKNLLSGPLPLHMYNISSLEVIALSSNSLSGILLDNICDGLPKLSSLGLSDNKLTGQIPVTLSQCSLLQGLGLSINRFVGPIPKQIGNLTMLHKLYLGRNYLRGAIPNEVWNLTSLTALHVGENNLTGTLPSTMGDKLSNLEILQLYQNDLFGVIPNSISNASKLTSISLGSNGFTGAIPNSLGNLRKLELLTLAGNKLSSESFSTELSIFTSLTNCRSLRYLEVSDNPLNGFLPPSVSNYSNSLEVFDASDCKIRGNIPNEIGNISSLLTLDLSNNELTGSVPRGSQGLTKLQRLVLSFNGLREPLDVFCEMHRLGELYLSVNQFAGPISKCLGNLTSLSKIYMDSNKLTSKVPATLWNMKNLQELNLSSNFLSGSLPLEVRNLKAAYLIDLSINQLSDVIPSAIGELQDLTYLSLENNILGGSIPESIGNMISLESLNLSHNNLSGSMPISLVGLRFLKEFDVSFNLLSGEIPLGGPFRNFTSKSFMYNEALCGNSRFNVPPCRSKSRKKKILTLVYAFSGITLIVFVMIGVVVILRCHRKQKVPSRTELSIVPKYERFSYYDLLRSTDGFSESNLVGNGSIGSVFRGRLNDGVLVAVKVFNLQREGAFKSFDIECEVLRNLHHRNLTKVIGSCSNLDFKALVLRYMANGNLEKWLHSDNHFLDLIQRVSMMIDVACALEYLHFGYATPVVHCDLKPSNILLDENMVAHVSDFGIAKMFGEGESIMHTNTLATLGYIAPEYGSEGIISTKIDVYSFGIILMETFSRMRPSDEMFSGDLSLKSWIEDSLHDALQVIDKNLIKPEDEHFADKLESIILIMKLALNCCRECPGERINVKDVSAELKKIKRQFLLKLIVKS